MFMENKSVAYVQSLSSRRRWIFCRQLAPSFPLSTPFVRHAARFEREPLASIVVKCLLRR